MNKTSNFRYSDKFVAGNLPAIMRRVVEQLYSEGFEGVTAFKENNRLVLQLRNEELGSAIECTFFARGNAIWVTEGYRDGYTNRRLSFETRWVYTVNTNQDAAHVLYIALHDAYEADVEADSLTETEFVDVNCGNFVTPNSSSLFVDGVRGGHDDSFKMPTK